MFDNELPKDIKMPSNIETIPISSLNNFNLNKAIQSIVLKIK